MPAPRPEAFSVYRERWVAGFDKRVVAHEQHERARAHHRDGLVGLTLGTPLLPELAQGVWDFLNEGSAGEAPAMPSNQELVQMWLQEQCRRFSVYMTQEIQ